LRPISTKRLSDEVFHVVKSRKDLGHLQTYDCMFSAASMCPALSVEAGHSGRPASRTVMERS
jgi:hypothetical protein